MSLIDLQNKLKAKVRVMVIAALEQVEEDKHTIAVSVFEQLKEECRLGKMFPGQAPSALQKQADNAPALAARTADGQEIVDVPGYMSGTKNADGSPKPQEEE